MGGVLSGRSGGWSSRGTVRNAHSLSIFDLQRWGALRPGAAITVRWTRRDRETGSIGVRAVESAAGQVHRVVLVYHRTPANEDINEEVWLTWTACHFGGRRPWFVCPALGCSRRVGTLHLPYGARYFACRTCYDLAYESQREDGHNRALYKAQAIRRRLGGSANTFEPFPMKPKRMHWRTYFRLWDAYNRADSASWAALQAWMEASHRRVEKLTDPQRVVRRRRR